MSDKNFGGTGVGGTGVGGSDLGGTGLGDAGVGGTGLGDAGVGGTGLGGTDLGGTELPARPPAQLPPRARQSLPDHPVRVALLDLLAEVGTVTSTQAAARLGHSSGLCSFHLRQLARHGLIEEAPHEGGRARPWQLRWESAEPGDGSPTELAPLTSGQLARDLEDASHQHWLTHRDQAPAAWQHDESFSAVLHLTPAEMTEVAASIRALLAGYRDRNRPSTARPADTMAVAAITRLFPLLDHGRTKPPARHH